MARGLFVWSGCSVREGDRAAPLRSSRHDAAG